MNALMLTHPLQPFSRLMTERIGWTLVHFLWQGLLIAVFYGAARTWLGSKATAQARYLLACSALIAMLAAPIATFNVLHPRNPSLIPTLDVARAVTVPSPSRPSPVSGLLSTHDPIAITPVLATRLLTWFVLFWMAGALAFSLRLMAGCIAAARLRFGSVRPAPPEWQRKLYELGVKLRVSQPVRLMVSAWARTPAVVGLRLPIVLVPVGALTGLAPDQIEALLLHELAHIRRHDYLVNILQSVLEALLFYHPAVWWISGHIRGEREACCDDLAVSTTGDVLTYVRALTELASLRPSDFGAAVAATGGSLSYRIARLLGASQPRHESKSASAGVIVSALLLVITAFGVFAQTDKAPLQFDVASIKPTPSEAVSSGYSYLSFAGGELASENTPLRTFIGTAYQVRNFQISGGPGWIDSDRYNIDARREGRSTVAETRLMIQALLADRFNLVLHKETRELPIYNLVAAKNGLKLPVPKKGDCAELEPGKPLPGFKGAPPNPCGVMNGGRGTLNGDHVTPAKVTLRLSLILGRPVIDQTGFTGTFNIHLKWTPDETIEGPPQPGLPAPDPDGPSLFTALEEQMGLKLQSGKGPVEILVIDRVERPSEN